MIRPHEPQPEDKNLYPGSESMCLLIYFNIHATVLVFFFAFDLTISDTTLLGLGAKTVWVSSGKHLLFWIKYKLFSSSNNWPPWLHILGYHGNVQH